MTTRASYTRALLLPPPPHPQRHINWFRWALKVPIATKELLSTVHQQKEDWANLLKLLTKHYHKLKRGRFNFEHETRDEQMRKKDGQREDVVIFEDSIRRQNVSETFNCLYAQLLLLCHYHPPLLTCLLSINHPSIKRIIALPHLSIYSSSHDETTTFFLPWHLIPHPHTLVYR